MDSGGFIWTQVGPGGFGWDQVYSAVSNEAGRATVWFKTFGQCVSVKNNFFARSVQTGYPIRRQMCVCGWGVGEGVMKGEGYAWCVALRRVSPPAFHGWLTISNGRLSVLYLYAERERYASGAVTVVHRPTAPHSPYPYILYPRSPCLHPAPRSPYPHTVPCYQLELIRRGRVIRQCYLPCYQVVVSAMLSGRVIGPDGGWPVSPTVTRVRPPLRPEPRPERRQDIRDVNTCRSDDTDGDLMETRFYIQEGWLKQRVCVCVCVRARACVRACVCACVCVGGGGELEGWGGGGVGGGGGGGGDKEGGGRWRGGGGVFVRRLSSAASVW